MLLNLTNHPSSTWSQAQKDAAIKQFGGILDMSFPEIDPESSLEEVQALAREVFEKIKSMKISDLSVHVMGEFTFCYRLLKLFEAEGIYSYSSTSKRISFINERGERLSQFVFQNFRPYYKIFV